MFVEHDYTLIVSSCGNIECWNGMIIDVCHISSLSFNLLYVPQLNQTRKKVEFWLDWFVVKDMHNTFSIVTKGFFDLKDKLYNLCDFPKKHP